MKKNLLCLLLSAALLLSLCPAAPAEEIVLVDPEETEAPARPEISLSVGGVSLRWEAVEGAEGYELQRRSGEDNWTVLGTVTDCAYTDAAVRMGGQYAYRALAFLGGEWVPCCEEPAFVFNPFSDVSGEKTVEYVAWAFNEGVVRGMTETEFCPDAPCSRLQFVMMLWKMNGSPAVEGKCPFRDVSGRKSRQALVWALREGIVNEAARFHPDGSITRVQIVMILWKLAGSPELEGACPFTDVAGSKTAKAVLWAWKNGITKGTGEARFSPDRPCTRVQLVVFLYKFYRLAGEARPLEIRVTYRGEERPAATDGDYTTTLGVSGGKSLRISADETICALYIVWEQNPLPWTLRSGGREERHGENGFLHELVRPENPGAELELQVAAGQSHQIADIYAFSAGTLPDWVQD